MDCKKIENQARKLAENAKPFILHHNGMTYTAVFNQNEWVFDVYEGGFLFLKINMKAASKAKKFLLDFLSN